MNFSYPCEDCSDIVYLQFKMMGCLPQCPRCKLSNPHVIEACMVRTPTSLGYNGKVKASKEVSRVPLNIIDEMPDGTTKVTRIGSKADINND